MLNAAPELARLTDTDEETIKLLETKARGLRAACRKVGGGMCSERARAALEEAEAILNDAASNCRDLPRIEPIRGTA